MSNNCKHDFESCEESEYCYKRCGEKISEYASEISGLYIDSLKKENAILKDRLKHEVEMIESAANDEIKKLKEENLLLRKQLLQYHKYIEREITYDELQTYMRTIKG
jgi:hypothetical protein